MKRFWLRIKCLFKGHSHPAFNCFHCGARSPLEFVRDKYGVAITDSKGKTIMKWRGWGW